MNGAELHMPVKLKAIKQDPYVIEASPAQLSMLAERFNLSQVSELRAELLLTPKGAEIIAEGPLSAKWLQPCAVSGEDFPVSIHETLHLRFVPLHEDVAEEEIELVADEFDEIEYEGDAIDLGEAVAQSLGLAIDPYATGPNAGKVRKEKGIVLEGQQDGPLAAMLYALKRD